VSKLEAQVKKRLGTLDEIGSAKKLAKRVEIKKGEIKRKYELIRTKRQIIQSCKRDVG
jgi:hypothetical protein